MEVPYSPELVRAFWLAAGGSILAADYALQESHRFQHRRRISSCLSRPRRRLLHDSRRGRRHPAHAARRQNHSRHDRGLRRAPGQRHSRDFCRRARSDGTAALDFCFYSESCIPAKVRNAHAGDVFTISLHQENNYPMWKPPSSIDVDLPDGIGDDDYLAWLDNALSSGLRQFDPELICYIAGADPYREDQLGGLSLTIEGLKRRDELVFRVARARRYPGDGDLRRRLCASVLKIRSRFTATR